VPKGSVLGLSTISKGGSYIAVLLMQAIKLWSG